MTGPLYRQIADDLRRKIELGELAELMQVPTEDQLMGAYHASRNTVRSALRELTTRGLVFTLHGRGTFVAERVKPIVTTLTSDPKTGLGGGEGNVYAAEVVASGRSSTIPGPRVEIRQAGPALAPLLQVSEETEIISRHQRRYVDGRPWSLQTSYYPRSLSERAPRLLDTGDIQEGTVPYLASRGIHQMGYRDAISWRGPDQDESLFLDLPLDGHVQVVEIDRTAFDQERNRFRLTVTVYRADRNTFIVNVGDVPLDT